MAHKWIVVSLLFGSLAILQAQTEPTYRPSAGYVPDAETAVKIGEAVLIPVYGEKQVLSERPFAARLQDNAWTVTGTLHCGAPQCRGGTAVVKISKQSGEILQMMHYK